MMRDGIVSVNSQDQSIYYMKNVTCIVFVLATLVACQQPKSDRAGASSGNEALVHQYFEHFNNHDWAAMAAMYAETSDFKDPSLGQGIVKQSQQQIIAKYAELQSTFPDVRDSILNVYSAGDKHIVVEFVSTGTAPDSSTFELPICTIFTIENGVITKDFTYYDNF